MKVSKEKSIGKRATVGAVEKSRTTCSGLAESVAEAKRGNAKKFCWSGEVPHREYLVVFNSIFYVVTKHKIKSGTSYTQGGVPVA